jgi:gliding motility-associated-like protein
LRLPLPATASQGTTVKFEIQVRYDDPANCSDKIIVMQTREQDQLFCPSQNKSCSVYTATSEFLLTLNTQNPDLILSNFEPGQLTGNTLSFKAILKNEGNGSANGASIKFYVDTNGNGKLDAGEPLLQDVKISQTVAGNSSSSVNGTITGVKAEDLCRLIAVISGKDNCACSDKTFPLGGQQTVTTGIGACSVAPVLNVGVDEVTGHTYQWVTANGISDPTKGKTTYTPDPNLVKIGDVVTLILLDKSGTCTIERRFDIKFGGQIGIESKDQTICPGETVTLEATAGGKTYNWFGPGVNASASSQVLNPKSSATYSVTVTFDDGCSGTGSVKVTVLPSITKNLPDKTTCKGNPVDVPGAITDVAGTYSKTFKAFNGCDSTVTQRLKVPNPEGFSSEPLCPGDTILIFGEKVSKSGIYSKAFSTPSGCDSTHYITVKSVPTPTLPKSDSFRIEKNTEITLTNPTGYVSYTWTPTTGLSCSNCASPVAKPDSTTVYNLKVVDANGCENEVSYRVIVFPPCFGEYNIPNAFTPNGDALNDVFRVVPINEGVEVINSMQVFDRWGRKVFEAVKGQKMEWDGKVDGKPGLPDVYYYIIMAECQGKTKESKGGIALLR